MIKNPIPWPGGARCAVAFTFDMDAESLMHLYFPDTAPNRVAMAAMLRYDAQVAVPRLLDLLARYRAPADVLRAGLVHRDVPEDDRRHPGRGARARPPRLHAREAQPALAGRRARRAPARDRGHREGLGSPAARIPRPVLLVLPPHAGPPARRGLRVRLLAQGRRHPVPPDRRRPHGGGAAHRPLARRLDAVRLPEGLRLHAPDRVAPAGDGGLPRGVRRRPQVRRDLGRRVASVRVRPHVARRRHRHAHRAHAGGGRRVVRAARGDRRPRAPRRRRRDVDAAGRPAAVLRPPGARACSPAPACCQVDRTASAGQTPGEQDAA